MRSKAILAVLVVACTCCLNLPKAAGIIYFEDGGTHDINYPVNDQHVVVAWNVMGPGDTTVNILDGAIASSVQSIAGGVINVSGGMAYNYGVMDYGVLRISGGRVHIVYCGNKSRAYISGGKITGLVVARNKSTMTIVGTHFNYGLGPIPDATGRLTGTLQNGDRLDVNFEREEHASIRLVTKLSAPPVGDANGPYTLYPGDTLTLDASGSTDDKNDIASYMWDLNDDGVFETSVGTRAVYDVSVARLESLGIGIDIDHNIHLKVIDGDDQADTDTTTLRRASALVIAVDIKPTSCPNPLNVKSKGVLPVVILGSDSFDVTTIDATSIRLKGVGPIRHSFGDVAAPGLDVADCNCVEDGPDGFVDLTLKFRTQEILEVLGEVENGDVITLELTGVLFDETPVKGADCILIRGRHKPINPADINKDGVVNAADFAIFTQNWMQSDIFLEGAEE